MVGVQDKEATPGELSHEDQCQSINMEAIGYLTAGIAHDFNNLLIVIAGNLHIVRKQLHSTCCGQAGNVSERVEVIGSAVERGVDLVRHLMACSSESVACSEAINIPEQIKSVFSLLHGSLGEEMELELMLDDDIWPVNANKNQFETTLINLVINARDAMGGIGEIVLEAKNITVHETDEIPSDISPGDYVSITVSDTGFGITPAVMARIFEPFYTTKNIGEGTGLGLSMVYSFVKQSGGYISVTSKETSGTVFSIYLSRA